MICLASHLSLAPTPSCGYRYQTHQTHASADYTRDMSTHHSQRWSKGGSYRVRVHFWNMAQSHTARAHLQP